nr:Chain S, TNEYYV PEPTIDE [synthetic construct]1W9O_T Chain T, TNEYYV PEPTIDE [synthetic construct]
TNEYYV